MKKSDYEHFVDSWLTAHEVSVSNKIPSENAVNTIFEDLIEYEIGHIKKALSAHRKLSKFAPTTHDVIKILTDHSIYSDPSLAQCPSPEEVITLAKLADTPLGVIARIQIGTHDLNNQDSFYLRQRAQEVIHNFDGCVKRCLSGDYTHHEIETMKKYHVDCFAPMAKGLPKPGKEAGIKLLESVKEINKQSLRLVKK